MQVIISVLRSGGESSFLEKYMADFDDYSYDYYVLRAKPSGKSAESISDSELAKVELEIVGGYLAYLRGVPNSRNGIGYQVSYRPDLIDDKSRCRLERGSGVLLFGGEIDGRLTLHFVGEKDDVLALLTEPVESTEYSGVISELKDCLDFLRNQGSNE